INERITHHRGKIKIFAARCRPFIHRFFENIERHDAGLQRFIGHDFWIGAKGAFRVANVGHAGHKPRGRFQMAVFPNFIGGDTVFGKPPVNELSPEIIKVKRAPINKIGSQTIGVNKMVDAPTQFAGKSCHGK
ncbi:MAG TPA: hypothetical protein VF492_05780, partial [Verrucomicrobiae bacterium]